MFHKILVALDESEMSQFLFEQALALAKVNHAELMLLHVLEPLDGSLPADPFIGVPRSTLPAYWSLWHEREQAGLEKLKALEATAIAAGVNPEFTQSVGAPGHVICALATTWTADLIIVGRRGLSGIREAWLGSVSNYVLHHAPCHVLIMQDEALTQAEAEPLTTNATD